MNLFRISPEMPLNHSYLRTCAVYRLLKRQKIGKARALVLLAEKHPKSNMNNMSGLVDLWHAHPIKNMLP